MTKTELIKKIQAANEAYSMGIPFMTDTEYDMLWQELYALDADNPILYHTARNISGVSGAITHRYPVYGTFKAFNMQDLRPFLMRFGSKELIIEPKYDGCAAVLELTAPNQWRLALEGDGIRGSDITFLIPFIQCPFHTRHFQTIEIVIPWTDWLPTYGKNPRNTVSGWTNPLRKESPPAKMTAVPHNFGPLSESYFYDGNLENLNEKLLQLHTEWKEIYPIDGLMIKVASEQDRIIIGTDGPRSAWSIAWKPPIQTAITIVTDIEWNVSRLGRIIPTVVYQPIELCGTTNQRVTGNNAQWILDRKIMVGSALVVGKAGEIIPKIVKVLPDLAESNQSKFSLPGVCPICESKLTWQGVHLICDSSTCIAKLTVSLNYFYSFKGIKIDGIGEATIEKILQDTKCYEVFKTRPWALLDTLTYNIMDEVISALGYKVSKNIFSEINNISKTKTIAHFIAGLGLPGLAYKTALRLCQFLKTGKLNTHVTEKTKNNFIQTVSKYQQALDEMKNFTFADLPQPAKAIYCVTGTLSMSRESFVEQNTLMGYEFSAGVTRETHYLVVGEEPGRTKIAKAQKHNIATITEEQFNKIITGDYS